MKKVLITTLLLIAIHFAAAQAIADMYTWEDQNGVIHINDEPPASEQNVETIETSNANYHNKVEIFTTSWCRYCKKAIAFLRSNHIDYIQYDIEKNPNAAKKMRSLGGTGGVPFAIINKRKVYGFSTKSYKQALDLQ